MSSFERVSNYRLVVQEPDPLVGDETVLCWLAQAEGHTYLVSMFSNGSSSQHAVQDDVHDIDACIRENFLYKDCPILDATHAPGEYHPRIHRNGFPPAPAALPYRGSWRATGIAARKIADLLAGIFGVVEPIEKNADAFGHELRQVLLLACMEVEAAWRGVLEANDPNRSARTNTKDYVRLRAPMRLDEWRLRLALYDDWFEMAPFDGWDASNSTTTLRWYDAYNHTKHDREEHLDQASLRNVIDAVAAFHIMIFAQFGEDALTAFGLPALTSFEIARRPNWEVQELYFGGERTTPVPRSLW